MYATDHEFFALFGFQGGYNNLGFGSPLKLSDYTDKKTGAILCTCFLVLTYIRVKFYSVCSISNRSFGGSTE